MFSNKLELAFLVWIKIFAQTPKSLSYKGSITLSRNALPAPWSFFLSPSRHRSLLPLMAVEYTSFKDSPRARARAKRLSDSSTGSPPPAKLRRPSLFNLFRAAIFGMCQNPYITPANYVKLSVLVILWSIIVLAIAVHFEGILVSSELSAYSIT